MGINKIVLPVLAIGLITMIGPVPAADEHKRNTDVETLLWTTLALNRNLQAADLKVDVSGGVARIKGVVDEAGKKKLAGQIAADINGIERVENRILVSRSSAFRGGDNKRGGQELVSFAR